MDTKWLLTLVLGSSLGIIGCGSSTPGTSSSGGTGGSTATGGRATGGSSTGGAATGGSASGGTGSGGTGSGGTGSGGTAGGGTAGGGSAGAGTAGSGTAGSGNRGGNAAGGGAAGGSSGGASTGGSSGPRGGGGAAGSGSAPVPSKGCGVTNGAKTLTTGGMSVANGLPTSTRLNITSGGSSREYIIDIPANYDPTRPYRLIFSWHQAYGSDTGNAIGQYPAFNGPNFNAQDYAFFGLHREATAANDTAIFVAPDGIGNLPWDFNRDSVLFDDLLALVDANLCIDDSRVFSTGFSFGAMMSYALSITRQTKLRAVVAMAAANYNLPNEPTDTNAAPVAYMGTTGMSDGTCPWVGNDAAKQGGKYCDLQHAQDNGCTIPAGNNIPTTTVGSKKYLCYDFAGCKAGYPVKVCTFDGAHTPASVDDGTSTGDDGLKAFIPPLAWNFIAQF
jgi:poly(3-hydroxybutyrate) depolymerase